MLILIALLCAANAILIDGEALRLCRELSYTYVVSQPAIDEFGVTTERAIDQQLMVRYGDMTPNLLATQECLFHWKNLMCSHVFRISQNAAACRSLCVAAGTACSAQMPTFCAAQNAAQCTNYGALTGFCAPSVDIVDSTSTPTPTPRPPVSSDAAVTITLSVAFMTIIMASLHFLLHQ